MAQDYNKQAVKSAILQINQREWNEFFEFLRQQEYNKLRSAINDAERLTIQTTVKGFDLVQNHFENIRLETLDKKK